MRFSAFHPSFRETGPVLVLHLLSGIHHVNLQVRLPLSLLIHFFLSLQSVCLWVLFGWFYVVLFWCFFQQLPLSSNSPKPKAGTRLCDDLISSQPLPVSQTSDARGIR